MVAASSKRWSEVAIPPPEALAAARLEAHWAAQIVAAASSLLEPAEDFSHAALTWDDEAGALLGAPIDVAQGARAGLSVADLTLLVVGPDAERARFGLAGRSLRDGLSWLSSQLKERGAREDVTRPGHDLPAHYVATGGVFSVDEAALEELAGWLANAFLVLDEVREAEAGASPVRCWPHHFDVATLIALDDDGVPAEERRAIGVGLSPGDDAYALPYWYVTPWPYPDPSHTLPLWGGGWHWHAEGFVAAVFEVAKLGGAPDAEVRDFLKTAVAACRTLLRPS